MYDQQDKLFQEAAGLLEQQRMEEQQQMMDYPAGQGGDYHMDSGLPFDQQMNQGDYEEQMMMPVPATERFRQIID